MFYSGVISTSTPHIYAAWMHIVKYMRFIGSRMQSTHSPYNPLSVCQKKQRLSGRPRLFWHTGPDLSSDYVMHRNFEHSVCSDGRRKQISKWRFIVPEKAEHRRRRRIFLEGRGHVWRCANRTRLIPSGISTRICAFLYSHLETFLSDIFVQVAAIWNILCLILGNGMFIDSLGSRFTRWFIWNFISAHYEAERLNYWPSYLIIGFISFDTI